MEEDGGGAGGGETGPGAAAVGPEESLPKSKQIEMLRQDSAEVLDQNSTLEERMSNSAARYGLVFVLCFVFFF